jgi:hypothetical protein
VNKKKQKNFIRFEGEPGEQVAGGVVAVADLGLDFGQGEILRGIGKDQAGGGGSAQVEGFAGQRRHLQRKGNFHSLP